MKKSFVSVLLVIIGLAFIQQDVLASTLTARIKTLRINKTELSPARTSVELFSTVAGPCFGNWYAFENAHTGVGKNMTDSLIAASQIGKLVTVQGTGTCDTLGVEKVQFIDMK